MFSVQIGSNPAVQKSLLKSLLVILLDASFTEQLAEIAPYCKISSKLFLPSYIYDILFAHHCPSPFWRIGGIASDWSNPKQALHWIGQLKSDPPEIPPKSMVRVTELYSVAYTGARSLFRYIPETHPVHSNSVTLRSLFLAGI